MRHRVRPDGRHLVSHWGFAMPAAEGTKLQVATGDYNDKIDARMAEIKSKCGLEQARSRSRFIVVTGLVPHRTLRRARSSVAVAWCVALLGLAMIVSRAWADDAAASGPGEPNLVKQANAPISSVLQVRLQNTYLPEFHGVDGQGNTFLIGITMPLPEYRLLPFPQLSLLTIPAALTLPDGTSGFGSTGFGDVRLLDIAVLQARDHVIFGIGPSLVFPTASSDSTGQGKW